MLRDLVQDQGLRLSTEKQDDFNEIRPIAAAIGHSKRKLLAASAASAS